MRRSAVVIIALSGSAAMAACSLLTSLDGYAGGADEPNGDAAPDSTTADGGPDVAPRIDAGGDADAAPTRSGVYAQAVLADTPLAYWRLEEPSGSVAKDETGRFDGTYMDLPSFGAAGVAGSRAIMLPKGSQARMTVASNVFRFVGNTPYSVELWAKHGELKNYQWLVGTEKTPFPVRNGWSLLADSDGAIRYEVWRSDDAGTQQVRGVFMPANVMATGFHHIVVTYSGSSVVGFLDGARGAPFDTSGLVPDAGSLTWACRGDVNSCLDDWIIDELAIYDAVLPVARVTAHFDLGK